MSETLQSLLAALHEERLRSWDPAKLQVNIDQRRELVEAFDPRAVIRVGDVFPDFTLEDVDGGTLTRDGLTANGPAVLVFFRFAGCPACNIALPHYQRSLWPELEAAGIPLVAVSPQVPERLVEIKRRHDLGFQVAADRDNRLGKAIGITYEANQASRAGGQGPGWIGEVIGTNSWELPQPTAVVIAPDATVLFADVSPDWLLRTEARDILHSVSTQDRAERLARTA
jgi:peroxiredoxin